MKIRKIELFDKVYNGQGQVSLIAECNEYIEGIDKWTIQLSRSEFTFDEVMSDESIIEWLRANTYSIYF
jgi:hypothetical protein